jgi:hypothetical protein
MTKYIIKYNDKYLTNYNTWTVFKYAARTFYAKKYAEKKAKKINLNVTIIKFMAQANDDMI